MPGAGNSRRHDVCKILKPIKDGEEEGKLMRKTTRKVAIHRHCYECSGTRRFDSENDCVDPGCDLYPFRPGNGPGRKKAPRGRERRATNRHIGSIVALYWP